MNFFVTHRGEIIAICKNKTIACALITAFNGTQDDEWQLRDLGWRSIPKHFGRGGVSEWYQSKAPNGAKTDTSWGPTGR